MAQISLLLGQAGHVPELSILQEPATDEGYSFVDRAIEEWRSGVNRFDRTGEGFFVAGADPGIVGMCGLSHDPYLDVSTVGRLRHLYVAPEMRRHGYGRSLVLACLELAGKHFERVRLRTLELDASAFYEIMGFKRVDEPDATYSIDL